MNYLQTLKKIAKESGHQITNEQAKTAHGHIKENLALIGLKMNEGYVPACRMYFDKS